MAFGGPLKPPPDQVHGVGQVRMAIELGMSELLARDDLGRHRRGVIGHPFDVEQRSNPLESLDLRVRDRPSIGVHRQERAPRLVGKRFACRVRHKPDRQSRRVVPTDSLPVDRRDLVSIGEQQVLWPKVTRVDTPLAALERKALISVVRSCRTLTRSRIVRSWRTLMQLRGELRDPPNVFECQLGGCFGLPGLERIHPVLVFVTLEQRPRHARHPVAPEQSKHAKRPYVNRLSRGDPGQTRTADLLLRRETRYPLRYGVVWPSVTVKQVRLCRSQGSTLSAELPGRTRISDPATQQGRALSAELRGRSARSFYPFRESLSTRPAMTRQRWSR